MSYIIIFQSNIILEIVKCLLKSRHLCRIIEILMMVLYKLSNLIQKLRKKSLNLQIILIIC